MFSVCLWTGTEERRMGTELSSETGWEEGGPLWADTHTATKWQVTHHHRHQTAPWQDVNTNQELQLVQLFRRAKIEDTVLWCCEQWQTVHTIKAYQPFISAVIGLHVSYAVLWLAVSQSPRPLTETLGQTLGWQYSGHTSPDLDLTPAITTNRHGRHIPPEIERNARTPFSELNIINYLSVPNPIL